MPTEKKIPARSVSLTDIAPLAQRLNAVSDDLNGALKEIEARIVALNVGLEVYVELRPEQAHYVDHETADTHGEEAGVYWQQQRLGIARVVSEWQLVVTKVFFKEHGKERAQQHETSTPLLQASREDRLAAVGRIPDLLIAIHDKAAAAIERIDRARALAESLSW